MYIRGGSGFGQVSSTLLASPGVPGTVPPRAGVSLPVAQQSCANAGGTWDPISVGCSLPSSPDLPGGYCSWFPFAQTLFSGCSSQIAADLTNSGAYTAYQAGMIQNDPAVTAQLMAQNLSDSQALVANADTTPDYTWLYILVGLGALYLAR